MTLLETMKEACERKHTTLTAVLSASGVSTGLTSSLKAGKSPTLKTLEKIADYLHISIDELVYGREHFESWFPAETTLTTDEYEWLQIIRKLPDDKKPIIKDLLRIQSQPEKYVAGKGA